MKGFVLTLDIIVGLQALLFALLFVLSPQSPANEILKDVQIHQQVSDLLILASQQGWLEQGVGGDWSPLEVGFKNLGVEYFCILPSKGDPCDPNHDWVCEKWNASHFNGSAKKLEFKEVTLCVPSS